MNHIDINRYGVASIRKILNLGIVFALFIFPVSLHAQYMVGPTVMAGGGSRMSGGGYVITGTAGQSSPVGVSSGGSYVTSHGFWHAVTGGGGLSAMLLQIVRLNPTTARLSWAAVTGATLYDLYRSTTPFFNASGSPWRTVTAPSTTTDFSAGIGDETTNYFFRGIARNAGQTSLQSNIAGEQDYGFNISLTGSGSEPVNGDEER